MTLRRRDGGGWFSGAGFIRSGTELPVSVQPVDDSLGRVKDSLVNEVLRAGRYNVDYHAAGLASGTYFYRIDVPGYTSTKKFTLLK